MSLPPALGTYCAHTKYLQIFSRANSAPKCSFTVQAESGAAGDKGNTAPIPRGPIQYTGLEQLQAVQGSLLHRPLTRVALPGAGHWYHRRGPSIQWIYLRQTACQPKAFLLAVSTLYTKCFCEYNFHLWPIIYFLSQSHFLTPNCLSRNPRELLRQKHHHFL